LIRVDGRFIGSLSWGQDSLRLFPQGEDVSIGRRELAVFVAADAATGLAGHDPDPAGHGLEDRPFGIEGL
jgi:hypothetical protein